jgi:hypothetical protein
MVYGAVFHHQNATWARVWIHVFKQAFQVVEEGRAIVCAEFDVTVDYAVLGEHR